MTSVDTQIRPPDGHATSKVSTDSDAASTPSRAPTASACEPYHELILESISRGRTAMATWQDLVDGHGFDGRYASVRRFVRRVRGGLTIEPAGIIETAPGEEAQVDYGEGPMVRDPVSGKYKRRRIFVMTLGNSRKSVRLLTWRSSSQQWAAKLLQEAFRKLGGTTRVMVLDNLREVVLKPAIYDPELNPLYHCVRVAAHWCAMERRPTGQHSDFP